MYEKSNSRSKQCLQTVFKPHLLLIVLLCKTDNFILYKCLKKGNVILELVIEMNVLNIQKSVE